MRYNFFRGGADRARRGQAVARAGSATFGEAETRRLVEEQMRIDYNNMLTYGERLPILQRRVEAATQVVDAYREQFELGARTLLDVLDVTNELFQARVALVDINVRYRTAQYQVLATMGSLLESLGIGAPDPNGG